ncbi:hypothetical protein GLAREA_02199 [Glarea lozoyensis ATCC 20868]|uniref:Uncharacterized protein n=1 Tax=Glarea lozoyensis (strain ATCC 20868 / MF5171) TaxID=1116229 RepID=S3CIJ6_GLAL2|nr:uncharacterized protein GLAREA_02199 [Glarea lozoyensis ATCC 20868]EPE26287.1 hypothetical protein GLAREA_02199 [Glarea lozoyensis ATCC 20868]
MSFMVMTQKHVDASIVTSRRSESSILAQIDDRLQRVINRTKSVTDGRNSEGGRSRRIRSNLGRKRTAAGESQNRQSLPASTAFNLMGDALRRRETNGNLITTPSTGRGSQDPERVSISDFPTPPAHPHQAGGEERRSNDSTLIEATNGAAFEMEPLPNPIALDKSFAIRSIDLLITSHPDLQSELDVVKKAIQNHENELEASKDIAERQLQQKLDEMMQESELLQKSVNDKDGFICEVFEKLDKYDDQLDQNARELSDANNRVIWFENEIERLTGIAHRTQREHAQEHSNNERQKRLMIEEYEEKLKAEMTKLEKTCQAKQLEVEDRMTQTLNLYRNYFNQQQHLYRTYFGPFGQDNVVMPAETGMSRLSNMPAPSENPTNDGDGRDESASKSPKRENPNQEANPSQSASSNGPEFMNYLESRPYEVSPGVKILVPTPYLHLTHSTTALRDDDSTAGSDNGEVESILMRPQDIQAHFNAANAANATTNSKSAVSTSKSTRQATKSQSLDPKKTVRFEEDPRQSEASHFHAL